MKAKGTVFAPDTLEYELGALAPTISAETMNVHYGKHYKGYVKKLNKLVDESDLADFKLEEIVKSTNEDPTKRDIFNNAGQVWNHSFFWKCLTPTNHAPTGKFLSAVERDFGGFDQLKNSLVEIGSDQFGSGWVWLVADGGKLKVRTSSNAESPMAKGESCLLTIDIWEHAYYLDYQNRRAEFLKEVVEKLLNWNFAMRNFEHVARSQ